jgi:hypothetical protein
VYTEEKLDEDGTRLEHCPQKSLRHQAQENGISIFSFTTFPKKELQHTNLRLLWRCEECVHNGAVPAPAVIWISFMAFNQLQRILLINHLERVFSIEGQMKVNDKTD